MTNKPLTWFELSSLPLEEETPVVFVRDWETIREGTHATVIVNNLNELNLYLALTIDGNQRIYMGLHLNPAADCHVPEQERDDDAKAWFMPSPLAKEVE